jgi:glutathione S-transferase
VAIILEELQLPYTTKFMDMADMKKEPYEKICINGRVPAIEDPNTGITLWESGAIIEYLTETYDKPNALSFASGPEKFLVKQWLHFQMSGTCSTPHTVSSMPRTISD